MRPRYLLLVSQGEDLAARAARIATATGLRVCHRTPRIAVLANEDCCCLAIDVDHLVVGTLFHRHGPPRAIAAFDDTQRSALLNGEQRRCWRPIGAAISACPCAATPSKSCAILLVRFPATAQQPPARPFSRPTSNSCRRAAQ